MFHVPPESPQFPEALNKPAVETAEFKRRRPRGRAASGLVRVSRTRYDAVDKKRAASVRTDAAKVNSVSGSTFKRATDGLTLCLSCTHVRTCVCAIYCAALSKEISPGAPKPFHIASIKHLRYCAAFFFLFSRFCFFLFPSTTTPIGDRCAIERLLGGL